MPVSEGGRDGIVMKGSGKIEEVTGMGLMDRIFWRYCQRCPFAVEIDVGEKNRTKAKVLKEDQVVVERRSLIVSLVYGFRCSPVLSGCRCLYLIRVAYTCRQHG